MIVIFFNREIFILFNMWSENSKKQVTGYNTVNKGVNKKNVTKQVTAQQLEDEIQHKCYLWFNNTFCLKNKSFRYLIFAVPNGGHRHILEAMKFKNTGVLAGVSDLIVVLPRNVLFIEMKAENGRLSDSQKDFKERVEALGFKYFVCWSESDFRKVILKEIPRAEKIKRVIERLIKSNLMFKLFRKMLK